MSCLSFVSSTFSPIRKGDAALFSSAVAFGIAGPWQVQGGKFREAFEAMEDRDCPELSADMALRICLALPQAPTVRRPEMPTCRGIV